MPKFDEAREILEPVVKQFNRLLKAAAPNLDDATAAIHFFRSAHCALQFVEQRDRLGPVDMDAVVARIDAPGIADTLPLLVEAYERCRPFWEGAQRPPDWREESPAPELVNTMSVLLFVGMQMYPELGDSGLIGSPHDLFASDT